MNQLIQYFRRFRGGRNQRPVQREPAVDWRVTLKQRIVVAMTLLAMWAVGIQAKLVYLQVFDQPEIQARAKAQQQSTLDDFATRGDILDRHGHVLATSVDAESVYAVPSEIPDKAKAVDRLCQALADCTKAERQSLFDKFSTRKPFAWVRRRVSNEQASRVTALDLNYVGFRKESLRHYPNKELAAHLLGWVGIDNNGLGGIEFAFNKTIRGKDGQVVIHTDAKHKVFSRVEQAPTPGSTLELTIDEFLQHVAERELHEGVVENRAASGTAIILDPHTGEILAMANEPTFDPNAVGDSKEGDRRNRAVQDVYEPGSTFKIVTASAAIEEKVMSVNALIDTSPGVIRLAGNRVVDEWGGHNYGVLSFTDVIVKSSNVGAIKIGFKVGPARMSDYVRRFGFGQYASPDFPGESAGIVWGVDTLTEGALASMSMGYQVSVTPLQMLAAVAAVANGGEFVEPRVVRAVYRDGRRIAVKPRVVRRAISADTAASLVTIMEGVVTDGTGKAASVPGFTVAGKTGTASKIINGHYSASDNNASFVGFAPSRKPAVAIIVMIDSPHGNGNTGGAVSAPVFRRIAEAALRHLRAAPTLNPSSPVLMAQAGEGTRMSTTRVELPPAISLVRDTPPGTVPDLTGMGARDASRTLVKLGLQPRMIGDGFVVSQNPAPGTPLIAGSVSELRLARAPSRTAVTAAQP